MAFGSGRKPKNQGSAGTPITQPVKTSPSYPGKPAKATPGLGQRAGAKVGYTSGGVRGTRKP